MVGFIGAIIGFLIFRSFFGVIGGYLVGRFFFGGIKINKFSSRFKTPHFSSQGISQEDFELNILTLSAFVIKADGLVKKEELNYVREYFLKIYGEHKANTIFSKFKEISNDLSISLEKVCIELKGSTSYSTKLQLLHFLFGIANSDGEISQDEIKVLNNICHYIEIKISDFNSIMSMFFYSKGNYSSRGNSNYQNTDVYYKILGIKKIATSNEIKTAYRKLAKIHHPDRVQHLGEEYANQAKEKFTKIQEAYNKIKKERGF